LRQSCHFSIPAGRQPALVREDRTRPTFVGKAFSSTRRKVYGGTSSFRDTRDDRAKIFRMTRFKIPARETYRDIEFPWRSSAVDLPQRDIIPSYANRGERGDNENLFRRFRVSCRPCERCSLYIYLAAHVDVSRIRVHLHLVAHNAHVYDRTTRCVCVCVYAFTCTRCLGARVRVHLLVCAYVGTGIRGHDFQLPRFIEYQRR